MNDRYVPLPKKPIRGKGPTSDKKTKLYNFPAAGLFLDDDPRADESATLYVGACGLVDALRLLREVGLRVPTTTRARDHWNEGAWGYRMNGILPRRGVWLTSNEKREEPPKQLTGRAASLLDD